MKLDQVTLEIRPRSAWEAVDLGLLMAKRWWQPMMKLWFLASAPFLLLALCLPSNYFWLAFVGLWWCKPLYERPLLHLLSHAVFNQLPDTRSSLQRFPALARKQLFLSITLRRFSPTRSMDLPVLQLEGLAGAKRQARISALRQEDAGPAGWLSLMGFLLELLLAFGMIGLVWSLLPGEWGIDWRSMAFDQGDTGAGYAKLFLWYLALSLTAPFYVACGFALYLNRRVKLEAWDIDIAFRRIADKRRADRSATESSPLALLMVLTISAWAVFSTPQYSYADDLLPAMDAHQPQTPASAALAQDLGEYRDLNRSATKAAITELMQTPEFSSKSLEQHLTWIESEQDSNWLFEWLEQHFGDYIDELQALDASTGFDLIATALELLLWGLVLGLIALLIYRYRHWLQAQWVKVTPEQVKPSPPKTLFGMAINAESLPEDISQSALQLWHSNQQRAALALLYRASLAQLIEHGIDIHDGHTEGECVQLLRAQRSQAPESRQAQLSAQVAYFDDLSRHWQRLAYGHQLPDDNLAHRLCQQWNSAWIHCTHATLTEPGVTP